MRAGEIRALARRARIAPGVRVLDLCCGTGDLALVLAEHARPGGLVLGLDAAAAPLELARRRAARQPSRCFRIQSKRARSKPMS